jgi:hypothetical protein
MSEAPFLCSCGLSILPQKLSDFTDIYPNTWGTGERAGGGDEKQREKAAAQ